MEHIETINGIEFTFTITEDTKTKEQFCTAYRYESMTSFTLKKTIPIKRFKEIITSCFDLSGKFDEESLRSKI